MAGARVRYRGPHRATLQPPTAVVAQAVALEHGDRLEAAQLVAALDGRAVDQRGPAAVGVGRNRVADVDDGRERAARGPPAARGVELGAHRAEGRPGGNEGVWTCRSRGWPDH